jgi:hypothetical protein
LWSDFLHFGWIPLDDSNTSAVTISDKSLDDLAVTIDSVTLGGPDASDFAILGDTCTGAVLYSRFGAQGSCQVDVRFTPDRRWAAQRNPDHR